MYATSIFVPGTPKVWVPYAYLHAYQHAYLHVITLFSHQRRCTKLACLLVRYIVPIGFRGTSLVRD